MLRLTLRNLFARKVRLLMSTLAIVLGIGFLSGVLTFSSGLNSTFDNIIKGSTPDAVVRPEGTDPGQQFGIGSTKVVTPRDVERLAELPEVAQADGSVDGLGMYLLDQDGKLVGGGGAPTFGFNHTDTLNLLDEPTLELVTGDWPTGTDRGGARHRRGREGRLRDRGRGDRARPERDLDRHRAHHADDGGHRRVQRRRHRGRHAARVLDRGCAALLPGRAGRLHVRVSHRRAGHHPDAAHERRGRGAAAGLRGGRG